MYLVDISSSQGTYHAVCDTLDDVRAYVKANGKPGDKVTILRNGDKLGNARVIII
jgi:hypothetical protein